MSDKVIGVRFKKAGKIYYFNPLSIPFEAGEGVIVETSRGIEFGEVVIGPREIEQKELQKPLRPVIRRADEEDYDDGIQYVSVMPARKRSKIVEEVTLQTTAAPQKRRKSRREPMPFEDMGRDSRDNRPRYEDIDFEERAKQEHLDSLYSNDYDDEYVGRGHNKLAILLGVAALLLIIFLIFQTVSLSSKLEEAQNKLTDSEDYKTRYEQVQLEKMQVQEELEQLKNPASANAENGEQGENGNEGSSTPAGITTSGSYTEYTVKDGETAWALAQRFLGNGMDYQKILDANNMKRPSASRHNDTHPQKTIREPEPRSHTKDRRIIWAMI